VELRKTMPNNQYPGLSPQFQGEVDDYNLAHDMTRKALDPRFRSLQRQSPTQSTFMSNYEDDMRAQDSRNQINVGERQRYRQASERDMDWRMRQQDSDMRRSIMQQELEMRRQEMQDRRGERDYTRKQMEDANAMRPINEAMNSNDPALRAWAVGELERRQAIQSPAVPGQQGQGAQGSDYFAMLKDSIARQRQQQDEDRAAAKQDRAETKAQADFNRRQSVQREDQARMQKIYEAALGRTQDPTKQADILNRMAGDSAALVPMEKNPLSSVLGMADVGTAVQSAYNVADKGARARASVFGASPEDIKRYEAQQALSQYRQSLAPTQILREDPDFANELAQLKSQLHLSIRDKSIDQQMKTDLLGQIERVAMEAAKRIPGATPETAKKVIGAALMEDADGLPESARAQLLAIVQGRQSAGPTGGRIGGPFAGADISSFPAL
jgi:hypothetical protein